MARLDKSTLLALDEELLSQADKKLLIEKLFPESGLTPWQDKLRKGWIDLKKERINLRRWDLYLGAVSGDISDSPYQWKHDFLVDKAEWYPPKNPGNRVTDFTNWIYSLYQSAPSRNSLLQGKLVERKVASLVPPPSSHEWDLIYEDPLVDAGHIMTISGLTVNGLPLKGKPDLVFNEKKTGRIMIVERKASNRPIPSDGWPNLRAQLWAYSKIDDWIDAPEVLLVGEIWGFDSTRVFPRAGLRWVRGEPRFEKENAELFELYKALPNNR